MDLFKDFTEREKALRTIDRWSIRTLMFYRPNLFTHTKRIFWVLQAVKPMVQEVYGSSINLEKTELLALVHDDPEIIIGDIQAGNKSKMTKEQLDKIEESEVEAINKLAEEYPKKVGDYIYKELLLEAHNKKTIESQLVNYLDKFDAFNEALHEIYGGNVYFTEIIHSEYGELPTPVGYYTGWISQWEKKTPLLKPLFDKNMVPFILPQEKDYISTAKASKPHTLELLKQDSNHPYYDFWKKTVLSQADEEELKNLYTQREFA